VAYTRASRPDATRGSSVKLVMTLLTRDQVDVVDALVAFHLHAGVDFVIATDHRSTDGTTEILESYERDGVLQLVREEGQELRTREWRTRMARSAAADHGADWVIGCDGDEFWWPRGGSLKDVLAAVPPQYGVLEAAWRFFLPRRSGPRFFAERMTLRLSPAGALVHPHSPFKPGVKIAHRGDPTLVVQGGGHRLLAGALVPCVGWHPIEVLHFPIRDLEQYERRHEQWQRGGRDWRFPRRSITGASPLFASVAVNDTEVEVGVENGSITLDTRLRDALRSIRRHDGERGFRGFCLPGEGEPLVFTDPAVAEELGHLADLGALAGASLIPLQRRVDELRVRVFRLERRGRLGSAR
jgi:Glycosyl transferase family 2